MNSSTLMSGLPDQVDDNFGEFELDEIFKGEKMLDEFQQSLAIEFLRCSKQIQLERLQCIADAALLALEQVQDIRLDLLEKGPEISTEAILFDITIGLFLDSSIPGWVIKKFANSLAKNMVNRNLLLLSKEKKKAHLMLKELRELTWRGSNMYSVSKGLEKALNSDLKAREFLKAADRWRGFAIRASNSDTAKNATAIAKASMKLSQKKLETTPLAVDGDTPGVSLLGSVQEFVSTSRLVVSFQYDRMETLIWIGSMTGKEARDFLRYSEFEQLPGTLKSIRDRCKLLFEAIIWAGMFKFDNKDLWGRYSERDGFKGIEKRLVNYWLIRFGSDIERWNKDLGVQGRRNLGFNEIKNWKKIDKLVQTAAVGHYFISILNDLPRTLSDSRALISNFDPSKGG